MALNRKLHLPHPKVRWQRGGDDHKRRRVVVVLLSRPHGDASPHAVAMTAVADFDKGGRPVLCGVDDDVDQFQGEEVEEVCADGGDVG